MKKFFNLEYDRILRRSRARTVMKLYSDCPVCNRKKKDSLNDNKDNDKKTQDTK